MNTSALETLVNRIEYEEEPERLLAHGSLQEARRELALAFGRFALSELNNPAALNGRRTLPYLKSKWLRLRKRLCVKRDPTLDEGERGNRNRISVELGAALDVVWKAIERATKTGADALKAIEADLHRHCLSGQVH